MALVQQYPLSAPAAYPRNQWYVVGFSSDFTRELTQRWCLGEPLVMYRTAAGQPVALADRCVHRRYPLSRGRLIGDAIRCGYHGATFASSGACVAIPAQERIAAQFAVKSYPLVERWNWVWIWPGDPALADPDRIPDHEALGLTDPRQDAEAGGYLCLDARYQLLNETSSISRT